MRTWSATQRMRWHRPKPGTAPGMLVSASTDEATTRKKNEMNSINVSPFATNVLDLIGKELVNSNGDSVLVKNCFNGFNVVVNGESKIICDDNLTVSRFLNSMEVSYK